DGLMTVEQAASSGAEQMEDLAAAEEAAAEAAKAHEELLRKTSDALSEAVSLAQGYGSALLALSGSQIGVESSIASLNEAIAANTKEYGENAGGLDLQTEAGRKNQQALDQLASASMRYVETLH